MHIESSETREQLKKRLRRIEGQVRGIERMLDEERDCREVVQQITAVRSAVQRVGVEVIRVYAQQCLTNPTADVAQEDMMEYVIEALGRW